MTKEEKENAIKFDKELAQKIEKVEIYDNLTPRKKSNFGKIIIAALLTATIITVLIIK